ncbi:MAG: dienelactone hydrolase family protein [Acidobacteria bacterium]|nr:dienelactone hydrolase family protein [Acidobacteriota bacterium]
MNGIIKVDSHSTALQAEQFTPTGARNGGVIVVAHGSDGMNEPWAAMIREYANELAEQGFVAVIPHYFDKTGTRPGAGVFPEIPAQLPKWLQAVEDVAAYARTLPGITPNKLGLLGFSLGGHICLRLRGIAAAVTEFFAPEFSELGGIGPAHTPAPFAQIHHGAADLLVPFSNATAIEGVLRQEGSKIEVFSYEGAGHGFAGADPNNATARRSSKARTLAFFKEHLA